MENGEAVVFPEKVVSDAAQDYTATPFFLQAAAMLTVWSVLVINEGAVRLVGSDPGAGLSREADLSPIVLFVGGVGEVVFGMAGLAVGVAALIFRWYNTNAVKLAILTQTLLGYYVFIVFVFVQPAVGAANLESGLVGGQLSLGESKFLITLGILTSLHFCLALQGGQFVFMVRLICGGTGKDFLRQRSGNRMRAVFWNMNLGFSGLWTLITGALIHAKVGGGKLDDVFVSPPNVGRMPLMTIYTGLAMMLYGFGGAAMAGLKLKVWRWYYVIGGYLYLTAFLNFSVVQLASIAGFSGGPVALHAGLTFMVVFLGPYFVHLAEMEDTDKEQ